MESRAYRIADEPYYRPVGNEVALYEAAYAVRMPMMLKGPTGCGKTRFVEHMAWRLGKPLITVACNEDMTASDLVGRYLLDADGTRWQDGPLTLAVRYGAICYLDEVVEARQDTTVVIHPLTDDRRVLPLEKKNELVHAHPDFQLVISYNPGYQSMLKDLKQSTKQRFGAHRLRLPGAGDRNRDRRARIRHRPETGRQTGEDRRARPQPQGPRSGRGHLHAHADLRRSLIAQGVPVGGLPCGAGPADHRRRGYPGRIDRHDRRERVTPLTTNETSLELLKRQARLVELIGEPSWAAVRQAFPGRRFDEWVERLSLVVESGLGAPAILDFARASPLTAHQLGVDAALSVVPAALVLGKRAGRRPAVELLAAAPHIARRVRDVRGLRRAAGADR